MVHTDTKRDKTMLRKLTVLALGTLCASAMAQMTPVGLWKTIDDKDGIAKSEVRIVETTGVISGKVEKILDPEAKPGELCVECKDERKDQPILGMEILRGLKKTDGKDVWEEGKILDPENGKTYKPRLAPIEGGKKLQVRGYIGPFFRTQIWQRVQ